MVNTGKTPVNGNIRSCPHEDMIGDTITCGYSAECGVLPRLSNLIPTGYSRLSHVGLSVHDLKDIWTRREFFRIVCSSFDQSRGRHNVSEALACEALACGTY